MHNYLDDHFDNEDKKNCHIIDQESIAEIQKADHSEYRIKESTKFHIRSMNLETEKRRYVLMILMTNFFLITFLMKES